MSTKKVLLQNDRSVSVESTHSVTTHVPRHHAYAVVGERTTLLSHVYDFVLKTFGLSSGHSDFLLYEYETVSIEHARLIRDAALLRPTEQYRVIVIAAHGFGREAQNALLKIFEEPPQEVHFIIIVPVRHILLPTVQSRLMFIDIEGGGDTAEQSSSESSQLINKASNGEVSQFLSTSYKDRLEWVKDFTDDIKAEKRMRYDVVVFLTQLQKEVHEKFMPQKYPELHKQLLSILSYAQDPSAGLKMLLEQVSLVVPIAK